MDTIKAIRLELASTFHAQQLARLSFETIWQEVQVQHGMEGEQRPWKRLKPLYKKAHEAQKRLAEELVEIQSVIEYLEGLMDGTPYSVFLRPVDKVIDKTYCELIKKKARIEIKYGASL